MGMLSILLWIHMKMASTIVATHGNDLYFCGYALEWPLLLQIHMGMVSTIVCTHSDDLSYCGYAWKLSLLL